MTPEVTIIIPNYKTPELTKLCLRSLRKYTDLDRVRIIVVDNDSADASIEYLRTVDFITLVERKRDGETGPEMHKKALQLGLEMTTTPFVMVFHTDTIVLRDDWLDFMLGKIKDDPRKAGTGSDKMEIFSRPKKIVKAIETFVRRMLGRKIRKYPPYLRTHCALYRTGIARECGGFDAEDTAGYRLYLEMRSKHYETVLIDPLEFRNYVCHLNHATMILNPTPGDHTAKPRARRRLRRDWDALHADAILADDSLDRRGA